MSGWRKKQIQQEQNMQAFPSTQPIYLDGKLIGKQDSSGMTLRQWYAGMAMQALVIAYKGEDSESASASAFEYADAMLKAGDV